MASIAERSTLSTKIYVLANCASVAALRRDVEVSIRNPFRVLSTLKPESLAFCPEHVEARQQLVAGGDLVNLPSGSVRSLAARLKALEPGDVVAARRCLRALRCGAHFAGSEDAYYCRLLGCTNPKCFRRRTRRRRLCVAAATSRSVAMLTLTEPWPLPRGEGKQSSPALRGRPPSATGEGASLLDERWSAHAHRRQRLLQGKRGVTAVTEASFLVPSRVDTRSFPNVHSHLLVEEGVDVDEGLWSDLTGGGRVLRTSLSGDEESQRALSGYLGKTFSVSQEKASPFTVPSLVCDRSLREMLQGRRRALRVS